MRLPARPLLLLSLLLAAPLAAAHVEFERPILQRAEVRREVEITMQGPRATILLAHAIDPLVETVRHDVDPAQGIVRVEHRKHHSRPDEAAWAGFRFERLAEYRDANADGLFTPDVDTQIRAWRLPTLAWATGGVLNASVGGVRGKIVSWNATPSTGPRFDLTVAAVGQEVVDEGARGRPQDAFLYFDVSNLPPRGVGNLHVLEGAVVAPAGATLTTVPGANNATVGLQLDQDHRRAFLFWGGQAEIDRREQPVQVTLGDPVEKDGNLTWDLRLHFPTMDARLHMVMVSAIEYELLDQRESPGVGLAPLLLAGALGALAAGRGAAAWGRTRAGRGGGG